MAPLSATYLTANFTRKEMRYDAAPAALRPNLEALARDLELIRAAVGSPLAVNGRTYRTPTRNASLPGAAHNSQHLTGEAADFDPLGISVETFLSRLARSGLLAPGGALAGSQLIVYPLGTNHIHYGRPRLTGTARPSDVVLVQTSFFAASPTYQTVALADSSRVYAQWRARRGQALLLAVAVVVMLGALILSGKFSP